MHFISDFCHRLSQASASKLKKTVVKNCKTIIISLFMLYKLGFILCYKLVSSKHSLVFLKFVNGEGVLRGLFSMSKPSLNFYIKCKSIQNFAFNNVFGLNGFMAISTSKAGLILDIECVLYNLGGKVL